MRLTWAISNQQFFSLVKTLIKNAYIIDGTNTKPFLGSVLFENDTILAVETSATLDLNSDHIIDAEHSYLAPGFIDVHSHADFSNFVAEDLKPKIYQGVTTEIVGQCGFSAAPMAKEQARAWRQISIIDHPRITDVWESSTAYFAALKANGLESNIMSFVGHSTLRFALIGNASRALNGNELQQLEKLATESFLAGAVGLSFGLIYNPAIFADSAEIELLVKIAAKYNKIISIHLRSESDELLEAIQEIFTLCSKYNARLHLSHLKAIGKRNWHKLDIALDFIQKHNLTFDHYPYIAGATTLMTIFPPEIFHNLSADETVFTRLAQPHARKHMKQLFAETLAPEKNTPWDNLPALVGWDKITITTTSLPQHQNFVGLSVTEIAQLQNKDPCDVAIDLVVAEQGKVFMLDYYADESAIIKKLQHPCGVIGSDSDMVAIGKHHPRVFGNFPRVLHKYVFQQGILPLETAITKMTHQAAEIFGLHDRGAIAPGYKADLVMFKPDFKDNATFADSELLASGLEYVFINGEMKIKNGTYLPNKTGQILFV